MAVRNFWVDADIDGRQTGLGGGPMSKDGGMDVTIYQRDGGRKKSPLKSLVERMAISLLRR